MRLKTITLRNIRSYEKATIDFPDGVTLLSGDIGSGKTSILLGVEFALFGIIRGSFSGDSLLRHGSDTGSVTLTFLVDGSTVTVHRELKRLRGRFECCKVVGKVGFQFGRPSVAGTREFSLKPRDRSQGAKTT